MRLEAASSITYTSSPQQNNEVSNPASDSGKYFLEDLGKTIKFNSPEEMSDYLKTEYPIGSTVENIINTGSYICAIINIDDATSYPYLNIYDKECKVVAQQSFKENSEQKETLLINDRNSLNLSYASNEGFEALDPSDIEYAKNLPPCQEIKAIKNIPDPAGCKPFVFMRNPFIFDNYIQDTLLKEVNRDGKPPLWLRPFAAICAFFGFYGVGQTNCVSCATSVSDTLKENILHRAMPDLRGGDVQRHSSIGLMESKECKTTNELAKYLEEDSTDSTDLTGINGVLVIHRPKNGFRSLFTRVTGHVCNIIKKGNDVYLVDTQKRSFFHYNCVSQKKELAQGLHKFIGSVGKDGLELYNVGFYSENNNK